MPPTIQSGTREDRERRSRGPGERRSELVCRVKYSNTLPDIPFDPKFITYPFESNRFVQYNPTSLERSYKYDLLTEHDLGVMIDLINPDAYAVNSLDLDPEDERLLEDDMGAPSDAKRSRHHSKNVSWLRKTEYISTEYNRFKQHSDKAESRINIKRHMKEEDLYRDRDSQIKAIDDTFTVAKEEITKHYAKPGVVPVDITPIYPDFELWKHPFAQVIFDSDPAPKAGAATTQQEQMSQAMIRGMVDESGDQFVAYFLPSDETLTKRKRDTEDNVDYVDDEEYDYALAREYNWNVKNKASKGYEETYFFVFREDGVFYNELETRVRLSKRRKIGGTTAPVSKTRLVVKHREFLDHDIAAQDARKSALEPPAEEEEEEELPIEGDVNEDKLDVNEHEGSSGEEKEGEETKKGSGSESEGSGSEKGNKSGGSGSSSGSSSGSGSGSESEGGSGSEDETHDVRKDAEEIFGSSSDSGSESDT